MATQPLARIALPQLALIAEPNLDTLEMYKAFLVPRRYVLDHAVTGSEALAKTLTDPPDVIVVETHLPVIDGCSLCGLLREDPKTRRIPIVAISSDGRPAELERVRRAGATSVLVKPCLPDALWTELERVRDQAALSPFEQPTTIAVADEQSPRRAQSRRYQRYVTATPPLMPPSLRCPHCDTGLLFEQSYVGGVTQKFAEQWDDLRCPAGCGVFQYRHRTRTLRGR